MTNFFQRLTAETEAQRRDLYSVQFVLDGVKGNLTKDEYISYLTQAYHHVKHTTPLLMLVGSRVSEENEWVRNAMAEYIEEELGHQEWILNDIKHCGGDEKAARNSKPSLPTELMVSYAYDSVSRKNPMSFFGMVFVLEGTSVNLATTAAEALMKNLNLSKNCFSYLLSHGNLDQKHIGFFENLVNQITNKEDQEAIIHMAQVMFTLFADVFRSIRKS
jgi:thiaminase